MAKARKSAGKPTEAKQEARPSKVRPMVVGMRGSPEWKAWLDEFADHCRLNKVDVIDLALVDYAKKQGFRPPPRR